MYPGLCLFSEALSIDLVLLTHGSLEHIGLYAYARAQLGLKAPTYATLPVQALGRLATLEDVEGWRGEVDLEQFPARMKPQPSDDEDMKEDGSVVKIIRRGLATVEEVNEAFESITTLKYSEAIHLPGKLQSLTLTAYSSSHTLGGTLWKLRSAASGTLLYAVSLNHLKEHHLDGTVLIRGGGLGVGEGLGRPDLLITDAGRVGVVNVRRRDKEEAFLGTKSAENRDLRTPNFLKRCYYEYIVFLELRLDTRRCIDTSPRTSPHPRPTLVTTKIEIPPLPRF